MLLITGLTFAAGFWIGSSLPDDQTKIRIVTASPDILCAEAAEGTVYFYQNDENSFVTGPLCFGKEIWPGLLP